MSVDALFAHIERIQGGSPWKSLLDAGTGRHSLRWIATLPTERWTAVTGDTGVCTRLRREFAGSMRPQDRVVCGNWSDAAFLHGERYNVVLADYLVGAMEGFSRYYQDQLFRRLRPHVGSRLYVVGLSPYPESTENPWGRIILEIARLRDACILLAGHSTYREYPLEWCLRHLETAGFAVEEARTFPISYGKSFITNQLRVAERKLTHIADRALAGQLGRSIADLRDRALSAHEAYRGTPFGGDYVIYARP